MATVLLTYLVTLSAPGDGVVSAASHWVAIPAQVLPLAICWWVAVQWRFRLPEIVLVTAAMSSFILGSFYNFLTVDLDGTAAVRRPVRSAVSLIRPPSVGRAHHLHADLPARSGEVVLA